MVPRDAIIGIVTIDYRRHCTREKLMSAASIPVDLLNPGQVFACLGFLEAADVLLGDAEGGFDWSEKTQFVMRAAGTEDPFGRVLRFLREVEVKEVAPIGWKVPLARRK